MSHLDKSLHFTGKSELATRYNMCLKSFSGWVERVKHKLPFYVEKQRNFSPGQVKVLDYLLCHYTPEMENQA